MALSDAELLKLVAEERRRSIGFDHDAELSDAREQALNYKKGEMPDVPSLAGRSKAVSTDVADAIRTVLPDLMEIFTGGDDVAVFQPIGEEDEEAARQETDVVNHVVFQDNPGFLNLYSAFDDALTVKTGLFHWWWEEYAEDVEETFDGLPAVSVEMLTEQGWEIVSSKPHEGGFASAEPLFDVTLKRSDVSGCVKVKAVDPQNFTVARDTVELKATTYCAMRSYPRAQDLIADGHDPELVASLPASSGQSLSESDEARDTAGENDDTASAGQSTLRTVEVVLHVLRLVDEETKKPTLWRILTGADEKVLLSKDEIEEVPFAALTPYVVPHRFYGLSVADVLIEVQKIKTALSRMFLDSGYFALNQRYEVAAEQMVPQTIANLLRNEPGVPVLSRTGNAVRPIQAGSLNFPALEALEHFSTVAEQRTGIVRNAQGLNPDTLHDTAKGAMALMGAAQKRVRLIARVFAETGLKDMFLGVHATLRRHATQAMTVRLRGEWVQVDPSTWGRRKDMNVEIGVGAGGRDHELMVGQALLASTEKLVELQQGLNGPFVTAPNAYAALKRYYERGLGLKSADPYLSDPAKAPEKAPEPPPPDPKMIEAQQKIELDRQKAEADIQLQREKMAAEIQLERERMAMEAKLKIVEGSMNPQGMAPVRMGGEVG